MKAQQTKDTVISSHPLSSSADDNRIMSVKHSVIRKDIQPFVLWLAWLLALTLTIDYLLHYTQTLWVEQYMGIFGTCLIVLSFSYSLRKKKIITFGKIKTFLRAHEYLAWTGALMVLAHGGIHFNAILPWAAAAAMLVAVISGLVGKYLLKQSTDTLSKRKDELAKSGLSSEEIEKKIFWEALAVNAMKKWKSVHKPITIIFAASAALHILIIFLFWRWN
ncbi:MAG TPA: hypothetical protein DDX85_08240 [Nitrospiraceae bacterium]|nr:hypothetical protein [Nitrospiraceae bacterium]